MIIRITKPSNVIWLFLEAHSFVVLFNSPIHILIRASWTFLVFSVGALYIRIKPRLGMDRLGPQIIELKEGQEM